MLTAVPPSVRGGSASGVAVEFAKPEPSAVARESGARVAPRRLAAETILRDGTAGAGGGVPEATPISGTTSFGAGATGLSFQVAPLFVLTQTPPGLSPLPAGTA